MALVVLPVLTLRKILILAACVLACAWFQTPIAWAQHAGHVGGGGHFRTGGSVGAPHVAAPHVLPYVWLQRNVFAPPRRPCGAAHL